MKLATPNGAKVPPRPLATSSMLPTAALTSHVLPSLRQIAEALTIKFPITIKPLVLAPAMDHQLMEVKIMGVLL